MKLNHINLTVTDALETQKFLEKYFGLRPMEGAKENPAFGFVQDENGMVITLIRAKRGTEVRYPDTFHIGFIQASERAVDEINARLKADGYDVPEPSRQHGSWTFYFQAPGGFTIEVLA
ncbi:MAG: VOC family protein [Fimbriimonas sp.]